METCNAVGCFKPRFTSVGGFTYNYCRDHWLHQAEAYKQEIVLVEGEDEVNICKKEGCDKPRMISKSGVVQTYCDKHQREKWAEDKRNAYQKDTAPTAKPKPSKRVAAPKSAGNWVDGEPDTIKHEVVEVAAAVVPVVKTIEPLPMDDHSQDAAVYSSWGVALSSGNKEIPITVAVNAVEHDCNQCEAKAVIEALRAKSPKLAKLIDAMQAEVEAARELGI